MKRDALNRSGRPLDIWLQQEGEPNIWYQRFTSYRLMGRNRSLLGCYREEVDRSSPKKTDRATSLPGSWRKPTKQWQWEDRAAAWDSAESQSSEQTLTVARSGLVKKQIHLESKWLDDEAELKAKAYDWLRKHLCTESETRITEKEKEKPGEEGVIYYEREKRTTTVPKFPPQWVLERFTGKRDYEKQFSLLMELLKSIMAIEDNSEGVHQVKGMIQSSLEGLLLEAGADEVRSLLNSGG